MKGGISILQDKQAIDYADSTFHFYYFRTYPQSAVRHFTRHKPYAERRKSVLF